MNPIELLNEFKVPSSLGTRPSTLVHSVLRELTSIASTLKSASASWNSLVLDLCYLGSQEGFDGHLPGVFMHAQPAVDWEETPVDPTDHKGKKPAWRKKGKSCRGGKPVPKSKPAPDSNEEPREDQDRGGPADGGSGEGGVMVKG
jgi:hypothetical protein